MYIYIYLDGKISLFIVKNHHFPVCLCHSKLQFPLSFHYTFGAVPKWNSTTTVVDLIPIVTQTKGGADFQDGLEERFPKRGSWWPSQSRVYGANLDGGLKQQKMVYQPPRYHGVDLSQVQVDGFWTRAKISSQFIMSRNGISLPHLK